MNRTRQIMAALAAGVFGAAIRAFAAWWKDADLQKFGVVLILFALAAVLGAAAFLYAFGFFGQ